MQLGYYAQDHRTNMNTYYTFVKLHCNKTCMTRQQRGHRHTDPKTQIQKHRSKNTDTCPGTLHCEEVYGMKLVCIVVSGGKAECNKE